MDIAEASVKNEDSRDDAKIAKNLGAELSEENILFTAKFKIQEIS